MNKELRIERLRLVNEAIAYADALKGIDRHLSEWTETERMCYLLSEEVKKLRRDSILR